MKIECPGCHLAGKVNELALPPQGRELTCPRCQKSFQVAKPPAAAGAIPLMNSCPSCQYATFTEEMFSVCPRCGMTAQDSQVLSRKKREREQLRADREALNRSLRNPDLVQPAPAAGAPEPAGAAPAVQVTARLCMALAAALIAWGVTGLANYYRKDWQALLSETVLVPVSRLAVFFSLGMTPWLVTLFGLYFVGAAYRFSKLRRGSRRRLAQGARAGVALVMVHEAMVFFDWSRVSSGTASLRYYAVGVLSSLFMTALLAAPFLVLVRYLRSDAIRREYAKFTDDGTRSLAAGDTKQGPGGSRRKNKA